MNIKTIEDTLKQAYQNHKANNFKGIQIMPFYLIQLIEHWVSNEIIYLFIQLMQNYLQMIFVLIEFLLIENFDSLIEK